MFEVLESVKIESHPFGVDAALINSHLGAVGLVQTYNWHEWQEPIPEPAEVADMSLIDCVKHVTRLVRADRTQEGILWYSITSGLMGKICSIAYKNSEAQRIPLLSELDGR